MKLLQRLRGEMETARLLLRRWKRDDFQEYVQLMSDPEVMLPAGAEPASTLEKAMTAFHRDQRNEGCFAIALKETGQVVGRIKFQSDLRRFHVKSLSLGYELRRDCWGSVIFRKTLVPEGSSKNAASGMRVPFTMPCAEAMERSWTTCATVFCGRITRPGKSSTAAAWNRTNRFWSRKIFHTEGRSEHAAANLF